LEPPEIKLTKEQEDVVFSEAEKLTVSAAAGAGKTRVLVERYLRHVAEEGLSPEAILTITFTRKAAAEMKERIVGGLRKRGLLAQAQVAETGPIQTIHSFCERLLRENAVVARIDPEFEVLSEAQLSSYRADAIRAALAESSDSPEAESLIALLTGHTSYGRSRSPYSRLESAIEKVLQELRGSGTRFDDLAAAHADPQAVADRWAAVILSEMPPPVAEQLAPDLNRLRTELRSAYKLSGLQVPAWVRQTSDEQTESDAVRHTVGLIQLACEAWWRLEAKMDEQQKFDFAELEHRAVTLMERHASVSERLAHRFKVAMIDEAQDLNPMQYRLLNRLACKQELIVGDAQQAIYGFRLADVDLFRNRAAAGASFLTRNWRSEAGILRFIDHVFGSFWPGYEPMTEKPEFNLETLDEPDYPGVEVWEYPSQDQAPTAFFVAQLFDEGWAPFQITILTRDGFGAASTLKALEDAGIEARIAGGSEKFYTRMEVRDVANALRAASDPFDDFALLACLRSPMVGLSLDSLVMIAKQKPVVEALEGFVPPIGEDAPKLARFLEWFLPLSRHADRLSAHELLGLIYARSGYLEELARRRNSAQLLANVRKLLSLVASEPELTPAEFADRIRSIQEIRHKEGEAPAFAEEKDFVTIMTVHKAKGLEFDVVVLPQTSGKLVRSDPELIVDARLGLVATRFGQGAGLFHTFLSERLKTRSREEELRVLYVAMTRARKRLCVALYPPASADSISKRLRGIIGDAPPSGIRVRKPLPQIRPTER
jgi:ATP-dependent helicase/nuclease subunit A